MITWKEIDTAMNRIEDTKPKLRNRRKGFVVACSQGRHTLVLRAISQGKVQAEMWNNRNGCRTKEEAVVLDSERAQRADQLMR